MTGTENRNKEEPSCLKQPGCTTHSPSMTSLFFHPPGNHAWTDLGVSVFVYSLYKFDDLSGMVNTSKQESFQKFLKKLSAQLKRTYATGTRLCLEDDSYNQTPPHSSQTQHLLSRPCTVLPVKQQTFSLFLHRSTERRILCYNY